MARRLTTERAYATSPPYPCTILSSQPTTLQPRARLLPSALRHQFLQHRNHLVLALVFRELQGGLARLQPNMHSRISVCVCVCVCVCLCVCIGIKKKESENKIVLLHALLVDK